MTIAELGRQSGVGVETVRYYQRLGLLAVPRAQGGGHRRYDAESLAELRFVLRCKALGFSLKEIAVLVQMRRARRGTCSKLRDRLVDLSAQLDRKRRQVDRQQAEVRELIASCDGTGPLGECEALARLENEAQGAAD